MPPKISQSPSSGRSASTQLVVDLTDGYLRVGSQMAPLGTVADSDLVLKRYVQLVREMRAAEPGAIVEIRDEDIEVLSEALSEEPVVIRSQIEGLMADSGTAPANRTALYVTIVLALLILVGASLALLSSGDSSETVETVPVTAAPAAEVEVTTAPDNQPATTLESEQPIAPEVAVLPTNPQTDIGGDGAVVERE